MRKSFLDFHPFLYVLGIFSIYFLVPEKKRVLRVNPSGKAIQLMFREIKSSLQHW